MKIQFESSTLCNARCVFCPRYELTRNAGEMSDSLFHKIIKEGKQAGGTEFLPFLNGEPFFFSRIWEWLDYMRDEKVKVHLYTNAELIDVERIVKYPNIRLICCSVNAASYATHQKVMRGPDYRVVRKNVEELIEKAPFPIYVSMVVVGDNEHEVGMFEDQRWP